MGLEARRNRTVLGIEISNGVARGARLDLDRHEIVALGTVRLGSGCCDASGSLDPSVAGICLDPLLEQLQVVDRSNVEVGIAIGPRHAGVGSGPAMQSWLEAQALRLGESITVAGDLGVSFAPSRTVDAAAKSIRELGLEPARVDVAPVAAARAYGQQVDGIIRVGSGRGWQARMRNFEVLEAMESADVACDEAMSIECLDGSITRIANFGYTEIDRRVWASVTDNLGSMAVAVGSAIGVAFESSGNLLDGAIVGEPNRVAPRPERPQRREGELDESTLTLRGRQHNPPQPMHRQQTLNLNRVEIRNEAVSVETPSDEVVLDLNASPAQVRVEPRVPAPTPSHRRVEVSEPEPADDQTMSLSMPARTPEPVAPAVAPPARGLRRPRGAKSAAADFRPTTDVQMAAMADWQDEALDQTDPINLFSPQTQEDHLRGESRHGFGILHFLLLVIVLGVAAAGAFFFLL
jgi:hypothetical protein